MATEARDWSAGKRETRADERGRRSTSRALAAPVRAVGFCAKLLLPVALIVAIGVGFLYVRLLNGPISLRALANPIANSIANELSGVQVGIEDVIVRLHETGGLEFRLRNVRFSDSDGAPIATAPLAAVSMSLDALIKGRLAPSRITLIEPRLLLIYSEDGGLAFTFARGQEDGEASAGEAAVATGARPAPGLPADAKGSIVEQASPAPVTLQRIDIARTVADIAARARRKSDTASFLREFGVRNAMVVFDHASQQSIWPVLEAKLDMEHRGGLTTAVGSMTVGSRQGPWSVTFRIEDHGKERLVVLDAAIHDLVPGTIAGLMPQLSMLEGLDVPLVGNGRLVLTADGDLTSGNVTLDIGQGMLRAASLGGSGLAIESGRVVLSLDPARHAIEVTEATLGAGGTKVSGKGAIREVTTPDGRRAYDYRFRTTGGVIASDIPGQEPLQLDEGVAEGQIDAKGAVAVSRLVVRAGGASFTASGLIAGSQPGPPTQLEGSLGPMSIDTLKSVWPRGLAPGARDWVATHVLRGQTLGGTLKMVGIPVDSDGTGRRVAQDQRLSFTLEASDLLVKPTKEMAPVEAPRGLLRVEGQSFEVTLPEAVAPLSAGRRLMFKNCRVTAVDIFSPRPLGELSVRAQGTLPAALEFIAQEPIAVTKIGLPVETVDGKVDGQFKLTLPFVKEVPEKDVRIEGKARLTEGRVRQLLGAYDVQSASVAVDLVDRAVEAKGEMLVGGVPTKLVWQRLPGVPEEKQPPIRLNAMLDKSDRMQLGLDVNHIVTGETPVEVLVSRGSRGELMPRVRVDLTNTDVILENLHWQKPAGRTASLQFDVAKGTRYKTELQNFKLVGDDIAVDGWLALDQQNKLREFSFPDFSINVVSRLEMQGILRQDNVWDVKASGRTYDGREFFRSLFSVGQITDKVLPPRKDQPGLDLKADIDNVLGYSDVSIKRLSLQLGKRQGKLTSLIARGVLDNGKSIDVGLQQTRNEPRKLVALSDDAGRAFRLVNFYPNLEGGRLRLEVFLDGKGAVEKSGLLWVERFVILGDPVVSEVLKSPDQLSDLSSSAARKRPVSGQVMRQEIEFDWMRAPFLVGNQQFVIENGQLRGPVMGVVVRGKADFRQHVVSLAGTYVPFQGLNGAIGAIPGIGQLLAGPNGEGIFGITYSIQGPMANPQVVVNPLALLTPGLSREFMQMTNPSTHVTPAEQAPPRRPVGSVPRSSSAPATASGSTSAGTSVQPRVDSDGGWSQKTIPSDSSSGRASP